MEEKKYYNSDENISLGSVNKLTLLSITKWAKFLAIVGFIVLGLMAIGLILTGFMITGVNDYMATSNSMYYSSYIPGQFSWLYAVIYLIILAVYFIPVLFLYKFAARVQKALTSDATYSALEEGFLFLKKHYLVKGILTIIGLVFFLISLIGMIMMM